MLKRLKTAPPTPEKAALIAIKPTNTFYVKHSSIFSKTIEIVDLTHSIPNPDLSEQGRAEISKIAINSTEESKYAISRNSIWGRTMKVREISTGLPVAEFKLPVFSPGATAITFPKDSTHCSHALKVKPLGWADKEAFVMDSIEYVWKRDREGKWSHTTFKLVKHYPDRRVIAAKYWMPPTRKHGGTILVDEAEIDSLVAILTCFIMVKKKEQKDAERSAG